MYQHYEYNYNLSNIFPVCHLLGLLSIPNEHYSHIHRQLIKIALMSNQPPNNNTMFMRGQEVTCVQPLVPCSTYQTLLPAFSMAESFLYLNTYTGRVSAAHHCITLTTLLPLHAPQIWQRPQIHQRTDSLARWTSSRHYHKGRRGWWEFGYL